MCLSCDPSIHQQEKKEKKIINPWELKQLQKEKAAINRFSSLVYYQTGIQMEHCTSSS